MSDGTPGADPGTGGVSGAQEVPEAPETAGVAGSVGAVEPSAAVEAVGSQRSAGSPGSTGAPRSRRSRDRSSGLRGSRRRGPLLVAAAVVLVAAMGAAVVVTDPFGGEPAGASAKTSAGAASTGGGAVATVREGPLSAQISSTGTLAYAARPDGGAYTVVNQSQGIYTALPGVGDVLKCGAVVYRVADEPVPLLCGARPFYRDLSYGDSGRDVKALNKNLRALGYAKSSEIDSDSDDFDAETKEALINLQDDIGAEETGRLKLGGAVLLPGPLRVTKTVAQLGTRAGAGAPVIEAGATSREVTVDLNAAQQTGVKVGDRVSITLPDNRTTPGRVSRIGAVADSADGKDETSASGASTATLPVHITLRRPKDAGSLDRSPVQVQITTAGVKKALSVPVTALVGIAGGGYAVERVAADGTRETVPVTLGLFDNAGGQVQVTGKLAAGDRVAVPST